MGSAQSYISSEAAVTAVAIAGAVGFGYAQVAKSNEGTDSPEVATNKKGKKKKQSKSSIGEVKDLVEESAKGSSSSKVVSSEVIPGQFEPSPTPTPMELSAPEISQSKPKKSKKKKSKGAVVDESQSLESSIDQLASPGAKVASSKSKAPKRSAQTLDSFSNENAGSKPPTANTSRPVHLSTTSIDTDDSWTRVGSRRGPSTQTPGDGHPLSADPTTSDAGVSTSYTGNSSAAEPTDDDAPNSFLLQQSTPHPPGSRQPADQNRKTLAEKMLPKPRKTGVDDMLETPDYPSLSRVMRVTPLPSEKPASGFSWGDYEDVRVTTDTGENDADGEDDGWGVVTSKKPKRSNLASSSTSSIVAGTPNSSESDALTKRQRQNAQKREKQKAVRADAEAERLAALAKHKRELERARMAEQSSKSSSKAPSGGMKATIDDRGKLVWE